MTYLDTQFVDSEGFASSNLSYLKRKREVLFAMSF